MMNPKISPVTDYFLGRILAAIVLEYLWSSGQTAESL